VIDFNRPRIMGILNITPDSFSDGGSLFDQGLRMDAVLSRAEEMIAQGADILDVGGESTRPGAEPVSEQEELARVIPVTEALKSQFSIPLSIDTSTPAVMKAALDLGAEMINDVRALRRPGALKAVADSQASLCLMHMSDEPPSMQQHTGYQDVQAEVVQFLEERVAACEAAGIDSKRICLDPGFGFGKTTEQNLQLLAGLPRLGALGLPILVGFSRKSMLGNITGKSVNDRVFGSVSLALLALQRGATILRVHDVGPTSDMLKTWQAFLQQENKEV
jgi:dihydropteroate synthase